MAVVIDRRAVQVLFNFAIIDQQGLHQTATGELNAKEPDVSSTTLVAH